MDELTLPPAPSLGGTADDSAGTARTSGWRRLGALAVAALVLVYACATIGSMRQTSTTFDEILMPAAGARGYVTGDFDLIELYHPRIMPYLYGLPLFLSRPTYSPEDRDWGSRANNFEYARQLYFRNGNNGVALAFRARLVAAAFGAAVVLLIWAFVRRYWGDAAAILAAGMTAFLPDLLAHGGITYNDVPSALAFFGAVWGLDHAARTPLLKTVSLSAVLVALALGVKYSAVALAPVALCLLVLEAASRGSDVPPDAPRSGGAPGPGQGPRIDGSD